ncbi:hypothetical protein [Nonomuraea sp. NPDC049400]|uniref:hypothetical protein n=1 Tax=Nonomuraea sp. NPDC049400 TaxID=3364352 RepID=UPI0037A87459
MGWLDLNDEGAAVVLFPDTGLGVGVASGLFAMTTTGISAAMITAQAPMIATMI